MTEIEKFDISRKQLAKASQEELADLKVKILASPAEMSWINKALEAALLVELFNRKGSYDLDLYPRVMYTVEDLAVFEDLLPIRRSQTRALPALPHTARSRVLFLSSKFGNFVSSQEYVGSVLRKLGDGIQVVLASTQPIAENYSREFEAYQFKLIGDLRRVCKELKIDKVVDISGNHYEIKRALCREIHVADVWGDAMTGFMAHSSLIWPELEKYKYFHCNPVFVDGIAHMFLPPEGPMRGYPDIKYSSATRGADSIVLGAFCRTAKLSMRVVRIWADIMSAYPQTSLRFAFIHSNPKSEKFVKGIFQKFGVAPERISFLPRMDTTAYLDLLNSIDINLGAMPEQGGISCMDSILMGCPYPVCDAMSNTFAATSVLLNLGLDEWVAADESAYRDLVDRLIRDVKVSRATDFRESVRQRLLESTLAKPDNVASVWNRFLSMA